MQPTYAVDFESTYTTTRTIKTLGVSGYIEHPDTDIYLVSIVGPGVRYCGHPRFAPWRQIDGQHWISHNAAFDASAFMELKRREVIEADLGPTEWDCTANMAVFFQAPRDLQGALKALLNVEISKDVRDRMKGKTWEDMTPEFRQEAIEYALADSEHCLNLWQHFGSQWPEMEVFASRHTTEMCLNGIYVDMPRVEENIRILTNALARVEDRIPWANTLDVKGKPISIGSPKALKAACITRGIPPPASTADKSEVFDQWAALYAEQADFVMAVKAHRRINRNLEILSKIRDQTSKYDGRLRYSLKYGGAHTLRWSGGGGLNFQNFSRDPLRFDATFAQTEDENSTYCVDVRNCFRAPPGKKFLIADLAQIEAVVAMWFAEDWEQLALIEGGMDSYEAHARRAMGYIDPRKLKEYVKSAECPEADRNMRQFAKCRRLGLQFGLGHVKFIQIVKEWAGITINVRQSKAIVDDFRRKETGIVNLWKQLDRAIRMHSRMHIEGPFEVEYPSWRTARYFNVVTGENSIKAQTEIGGLHEYQYGGLLFQNMVQATARDLLVEILRRVHGVVGQIVLHVHDEIIVEVDESVPCSHLKPYMEVTPPWAARMPIRADVNESPFYRKF